MGTAQAAKQSYPAQCRMDGCRHVAYGETLQEAMIALGKHVKKKHPEVATEEQEEGVAPLKQES